MATLVKAASDSNTSKNEIASTAIIADTTGYKWTLVDINGLFVDKNGLIHKEETLWTKMELLWTIVAQM